jgi:hypothetical protein
VPTTANIIPAPMSFIMVKFFNNEQKKHPDKTSEYFDLPE